MMSLPDPTRLSEAVQRGRLTAQESAQLQQYLAAHPEEQTSWEEELSLNDLLRQIPDVPVSSNFTSQVLQAVRAEKRAGSTELGAGWRALWARHWLPKLATSLSVLAIGALAYHYHQEATVRQELARNLAEISEHSGGATIELLQNFDAIQRLGQVQPNTDKDLIAALQ